MSIELAVIFLYILFQLFIGWWVSRRIKSDNDYFRAGRSNGYLLISFSAFATWFGAETCIGTSGVIYEQGLSGGRADPFGYTLCLIFFAIFFARKIWSSDITTLGDLLRQRFGSGVELLLALILVPSSLLWAAAQMRAMGQIFSSVSDMNLDTALFLAATIIVAYTAIGGFMADAISDVVQGGILIAGLVVITVAIFLNSGHGLEIFSKVDPSRLKVFTGENPLVQIDRWMVPIIGSTMAQELVSRVSAARSATVAQRAVYIAAGIYLFVGSLPVLMGFLGPVVIPGLSDSEQVLPMLAKTYLPFSMFLLFSGALVAAILSTVDSALLAVGALVSHNILPRYYPRIFPQYAQVPESIKVRAARTCVVISGLVAYAIAISSEKIFELVHLASSLGTAGIVVVVSFTLYSKFGNKWAAYATLLVGLVSLQIFDHAELSAPYILALACSLATYILVSLMVRK